jgi:hypothetical protein
VTLTELSEAVKALITTSETKDYTNIDEWLEAGDTEGYTPQQLADEWDNLPPMEKD